MDEADGAGWYICRLRHSSQSLPGRSMAKDDQFGFLLLLPAQLMEEEREGTDSQIET